MAPGPGRGHADPRAGRELRVADCLEGAHLLVSRLDEPGLVVGPRERAEYSVDSVAGIAEDVFDLPVSEPLQEKVGHCRHVVHYPQRTGRLTEVGPVPVVGSSAAR